METERIKVGRLEAVQELLHTIHTNVLCQTTNVSVRGVLVL